MGSQLPLQPGCAAPLISEHRQRSPAARVCFGKAVPTSPCRLCGAGSRCHGNGSTDNADRPRAAASFPQRPARLGIQLALAFRGAREKSNKALPTNVLTNVPRWLQQHAHPGAEAAGINPFASTCLSNKELRLHCQG